MCVNHHVIILFVAEYLNAKNNNKHYENIMMLLVIVLFSRLNHDGNTIGYTYLEGYNLYQLINVQYEEDELILKKRLQ